MRTVQLVSTQHLLLDWITVWQAYIADLGKHGHARGGLNVLGLKNDVWPSVAAILTLKHWWPGRPAQH